jgi:hypothetical protein
MQPFLGLLVIQHQPYHLTVLRSVLLLRSGVFCKPLKVHQNSVHDCLGIMQGLQVEVGQLQRGNASLIDTVAGLKVQVHAVQRAAML